VGGDGTHPAALHALPEQPLIQAGHSDQPVHRGAQRRHFAEAHTEQRRDEIETGDRDQPPVERSDDDEHGGDDVQLLHDVSLRPGQPRAML
jgi:hypothetical protein